MNEKKTIRLETAAAIAIGRFLMSDGSVWESYDLGRPIGRNVNNHIEQLKSHIRLDRKTGNISVSRRKMHIAGTFMCGPDFILFCFSSNDREGSRLGSFYCYIAGTAD